jgi:hypothetical protein
MEFNRNQYFMAGMVLLLLGIQLRLVDTYVLNEKATHFLTQRLQQIKGQQVASAGDASTLMGSSTVPAAKHRLRRPKWMGYSTISIGGVLILYSLALKKPGG